MKIRDTIDIEQGFWVKVVNEYISIIFILEEYS